MYSLFESFSYMLVILTEYIASKAWYKMQHSLKWWKRTCCHGNTFNLPGQGLFTNMLWLLSNGKLFPRYEFWVMYYMPYMFRHANNTVLVSQPYLCSNYKEIPAIYWMTLVLIQNGHTTLRAITHVYGRVAFWLLQFLFMAFLLLLLRIEFY